MTDVLRVENLHKYYPIRKGLVVNAVNGVNFCIESGRTLGLVGESGCGKTTIGRCAVRLITPTKGNIYLLGEDVAYIPEKEFRVRRSEVQIVFQEPYDALNLRKKIRQIIEAPLIHTQRLSLRARRLRVVEVLKLVELGEEYLEKYPIQLTQGEQQRIGIARAIATNPKLVVLDEPTSLLDIRFRAEVVTLLRKLQVELNMSYLFVSHDLLVVAQLSHRIAVMYLGRIVENGPTETVFESPRHPYTRALLGSVLFPDPHQKRGDFVLKGEVPSPVNLAEDRCSLAPRCPQRIEVCTRKLPELTEVEEDHQVACFNLVEVVH